MSLEETYVPLEEALELHKKQQHLLPTVTKWRTENEYGELPRDLQGGAPKAFLLRQIATTRVEDAIFLLKAEQAGLRPTWLEHTADQFSFASALKRSYLHPLVITGVDRSPTPRSRKHRLVRNFDRLGGTKLIDIKTDDGRNITDVHHSMQDRVFGNVVRHDLGSWIQGSGRMAKSYYPTMLSLAIAHGIMFEDYVAGVSDKELFEFRRLVFLPAYKIVCDQFGVMPLIVRMPKSDNLKYFIDQANWQSLPYVHL